MKDSHDSAFGSLQKVQGMINQNKLVDPQGDPGHPDQGRLSCNDVEEYCFETLKPLCYFQSVCFAHTRTSNSIVVHSAEALRHHFFSAITFVTILSSAITFG